MEIVLNGWVIGSVMAAWAIGRFSSAVKMARLRAELAKAHKDFNDMDRVANKAIKAADDAQARYTELTDAVNRYQKRQRKPLRVEFDQDVKPDVKE